MNGSPISYSIVFIAQGLQLLSRVFVDATSFRPQPLRFVWLCSVFSQPLKFTPKVFGGEQMMSRRSSQKFGSSFTNWEGNVTVKEHHGLWLFEHNLKLQKNK